jgi:hypothetical protein
LKLKPLANFELRFEATDRDLGSSTGLTGEMARPSIVYKLFSLLRLSVKIFFSLLFRTIITTVEFKMQFPSSVRTCLLGALWLATFTKAQNARESARVRMLPVV